MKQIDALDRLITTNQSDDATVTLQQIGSQLSDVETIALIGSNGSVIAIYPLQGDEDGFVERLGTALSGLRKQIDPPSQRGSMHRLIVEDDYGYAIALDVGGDNFLLVLTSENVRLGFALVETNKAMVHFKETLGKIRQTTQVVDSPKSTPKNITHDLTRTHKPSPRTDVFTVIAHWLLVAAITVSLLTGLRIAADYEGSVVGIFADSLEAVLPRGAVIQWHNLSGWVLLFIILAYPLFMWRSNVAERLKLDQLSFGRIASSWRAGKLWSDEPSWLAINRLLSYFAFFLIIFMMVTGLILYFGWFSILGQESVATAHGVTACAFVAYVFLHILFTIKAGTFWKIFRPRLVHLGASMVAVVAAASLLSAAYIMDRSSFKELKITQVTDAPTLDGHGNDRAWRDVPAITIDTVRGANFPNGAVSVTAKAVHDGERFYFLFRWPDPQRSQKHLPLVKTEEGWQVMQSEFEVNDEDDFYEDKFAVLLSHSPATGSRSVHLGKNLIPGPHRPTNRGLHFTSDGSYADMWHWKSVRTGGMRPGLADDDHFGPPKPSEKPGKRYTGGYAQDPFTEGGYTLNWTKLDNQKALNETFVVPKFIPIDSALLHGMGQVNLDPAIGDKGIWYLTEEETVPYRPELDNYPVDTVLPGVIIKGPFVGDRGDVRAEGNWKDGFWTLETARVFDTQSSYDIPISRDGNGPDVFLWVSAFNHTQTRHSQHLRPVRLSVE